MKNKSLMKILSVFLAVTISFCSSPLSRIVGFDLSDLSNIKAEAASYSGSCGDGLAWILNTDTDVLFISGTGNMYDYTAADAPWFGIGMMSLKEVVIDDGVTSIGDYAFYNLRSLTTVKIPDSVVSIGESSFSNCLSLTSVLIPDGVIGIGSFAFYSCPEITSVTVPESVTSIDKFAYYGCTSLATVSISGSVTSIGDFAFSNCTNLEKITVEKDNCYYSSDEHGVLYNKSKTMIIQYPVGNTRTSFVISDGVTTIGTRAFYYCESLASVIIPDSVINIEEEAFLGASELESITIPDSVTNIGECALYCCDSLKSIVVDNENENYSSDEYGVLYNKSKTNLIQYPIGNARKSFTIPDGVTNIGEDAFSLCLNLTSVVIPDGVTGIGYAAFCGCEKLESIIIPDSVEYVADSVFASCYSLKSVTIPKGVTQINVAVFSNCTGLESIIIPETVTVIGYCAFMDCTSLTDVYYGGTETEWGEILIDEHNGCLTNAAIHFDYIYTRFTIADLNGNVISEEFVDGNVTEYFFENLADGKYILTVAKENYATREYAVTAENNQASGSFELNLLGDVDGNGKVNTLDVALTNACAKGVKSLEDYELSCADINGDGRVNTLDVARMNAHAKGVTTLW